jgi:hypothetical protein
MSEELLSQWLGKPKENKDPIGSFLDDTFGTAEPEPEVTPVEAAQEISEEHSDEATMMSEVEIRLNKAKLYQQLLSGNLFDVSDPVVDAVEAEYREFSSQKLQELLGMRPIETNISAFSEEEVYILKSLAANMASNAKIMASLPKQTQTTAKPTAKAPIAPIAPIKPVVVPSEPTLKVRSTPRGVGRPAGVKNPPKTESVAKPAGKPTTPAAKPSVADTKIQGIPADESVIVENGKKYSVRHNELIDAPAADADRLRAMTDNTTMVLSDGTWIGCTSPGRYVRLRKVPLKNQGHGPGAAPSLSNQQMEAVLAQQASMAGSGMVPGVSIWRQE